MQNTLCGYRQQNGYVPEYDALNIESEEGLLSVLLSVDIKDWLRKKGEQTGKSMQDIVAEILEEVYKREQGQSRSTINQF